MFNPLDLLSALPKSGSGPALPRLRAAFGPLWERIASLPHSIVHIVGSNGKGSTAAFLEALLRRQGLRTGLFTSPHYHHFGERFRINGKCVGDGALRDAWSYFARGEGSGGFGSFEAMTVMAGVLFAEAEPDALVIEAGIGGRHDPTRMFGGGLGVLTSVDLEHTELLGETREEIAADKLDVIGPGGTIILGWLEPGLRDFCSDHAARSGIELLDATAALSIDASRFSEELTIAVEARGPFGAGLHVDYNIPAAYFVKNSILALLAARKMLMPKGAAATALMRDFVELCRTFSMVGRFEKLLSAPPVYCDVAHTPGAIDEVLATCAMLFQDAKPIFVTGMSFDKHYPEMCRRLAAHGDRFLVFPARHKGMAPDALAACLRRANPGADIRTFDDPEAAAQAVRMLPCRASQPIVATGGLFSAVEFRAALLGKDPASLRFY